LRTFHTTEDYSVTRRRVQILPEQIANKIAAGEVVQRPESVVKELLENALDAGSTRITVVVKEGGTKLVQVTDDGIGMDEADALASFLRHATSKIVAYEDLEEIRTFGFRGEALASIAAVAQVTMKTRRAEDDAATVVRIDGGSSPRVTREGREPGTTVIVQNLFFNVPARRKFLKSPTTEFRHVYDAVHRVAISYPEIGLEFISDDDQIFNLPPAPLSQRLRDVFGERRLEALIPVEETSDVLTARGYIGKPTFGQKSRSHQYLFLNRRYIVSRNINHAVFSAYENLLLKGTFPFFLLYLDVDPRRVDVNVHPSKMEVKFEDEQGIYHFIASLVRKSLASSDFVPSLSLRPDSGAAGETGLRFTGRQHAWPGGNASVPAWNLPGRETVDSRTGEILPAGAPGGTALAGQLLGNINERFAAAGPTDAAPAEGAPTGLPGSGPVWQVHSKYILAPVENGLMIVDQHVAHERVLYERALRRFTSGVTTAQQLLFPRTVQLLPSDYALVGELLKELEQLGFDIKLFGKNTVIVEGVPSDVRVGDEEKILEEILTLYKEYRRDSPTAVRDNLAKSFSCRSAVKAGDPLNETEMRSLLAQLFATTMPYVCPHGRPVVLRISIDELDKRFGRT
jgi:DNA mismatch repair protein MutL